jgi:hypothetical protein
VPAITGIHEQIFLEARDSADDRHESGLESSRCLFTSCLLPRV